MKGNYRIMEENMFNTPRGKKESTVDMVINRFRELIMQHKLKPGYLLPSEGVLAQSMNVSRGSLREAMKILSAMGVVEIRRGDGTYVSGDIGQTLLDPFLLRLMMNDYDKKQMIEFREMIEFDVARAIIRNNNAQGVALIRQAIEQMENASSVHISQQETQYAELDIAFHRAMGKATGNVLIEQLYEFILTFFRPSIEETYRQHDNIPQALLYHRHIMEAIDRGSEEETLRAIEASIKGWANKEDQP